LETERLRLEGEKAALLLSNPDAFYEWFLTDVKPIAFSWWKRQGEHWDRAEDIQDWMQDSVVHILTYLPNYKPFAPLSWWVWQQLKYLGYWRLRRISKFRPVQIPDNYDCIDTHQPVSLTLNRIIYEEEVSNLRNKLTPLQNTILTCYLYGDGYSQITVECIRQGHTICRINGKVSKPKIKDIDRNLSYLKRKAKEE
jgi:DNA-directed RNA polymerase specialized sigma24 family protein